MNHSPLYLISSRLNDTPPSPPPSSSSDCYSDLPDLMQQLTLRSPNDARLVRFVIQVLLAPLPPIDSTSHS